MAQTTGGLIVGSIIGGLTNFLQTRAKNKATRSQAQQLINNARALQGEIARGEVNLQEAMTRIDTLIDTAKGEIKDVMEKQVNLATEDIKKQYREGLTTAMDAIRTELGQRRLLGTGFGQETRAKTAKQLAGQAEEQTARLRERAAAEIAKQMAALGLRGGLLKEAKRGEFEGFRLGTLGEVMQLQNMATALKESQASPALAAISGAAAGGLGDIISQFFTPGEELRETGTGSMALPATTPITLGTKKLTTDITG
jgi:hypothetical protein